MPIVGRPDGYPSGVMTLDGRVIYQLDAASFGGDLTAVRQRLDHVRALGADTVWIQPFYVSPYRDAGYDVVDHRGVSQR
ncbi:MAG TPA: alpha-amylase family glycosyl hydrolase, partial [Kribbella sp.]|nr:alpha-amylase family glycosyl hydrolase [Kribbella sp.]